MENVEIKYRNYLSLRLSTVANLLKLDFLTSFPGHRKKPLQKKEENVPRLNSEIIYNFDKPGPQIPYLSVLPDIITLSLLTEGEGVSQTARLSVKQREELSLSGGGG